MKLSKYILMTSALLMGTAAFAEDFGDFGDFDDAASDGASSKVEVGGTLSTDIRAYVDVDDSDELEVEAKPAGNLTMSYSGNNSDLTLSLSMDADKIQNNPEDIIDELVLRGRLGDYLTLEAGKMKVVWGKGDKLHVLDNFNADNYTNFIIPDYIDRRVSTPMLRAVISAPVANLNIEGIYTPLLPVDRLATSGKWTPEQVRALTACATSAAEVSMKKYITDCETYRTGLAAATTIATSSEAQAKAAQQAAAAYEAKITEYNEGLTKVTAGIPTLEAAIAQLGTAIAAESDATKKAAYEAEKAAYEAKLTEAQTTKAYLESTEMVASIAHCKAEKTAQEEAATQYAAAATEAAAQAELYKAKLTAADTAYTLALNNTTSLAENIYPDMKTLKYGQFGGRATWTLGQVDMGLSYYNGWYKQPSVNRDKLNTFIEKYLAGGAASIKEEDKFLAYDKKQTFGVEASSILWHFNLRGEFAYNLTDDTDGTDPWVHNNSIGWLGGFDIDLPFANANLNVQETGTYILNNDECEKNTMDVDYAENAYTNNKVAANLTASFMNDKIAPEVTVMYGFENKDLVVMPKLSYKADQNLTLAASGMYIWCGDDNSEFKPWEKNSFVNLGAKYQF